jgi:hypothetical protein
MRAYDPESLEQAQPLMLDANNRILKTTKNGGSFIKSRHFFDAHDETTDIRQS